MNNLLLLKQQLADFIANYQPDPKQPISVFKVELSISIPLLSWLKAQTVYPQFYLKLRDKPVTITALGKVRSFSDKILAEQFMQQYGLTLVGGVQFYGDCTLYVPQLLLCQQQDKLICSLFIDNQQPLENQYLTQLITHLDQYQLLLSSSTTQIIEQQQQASFTQWQQWIAQALDAFKTNKLSKVVLANQYCFNLDNQVNSKDLLWQSEQVNFACYHFLFAEQEQQAFIGSSPECLYQREQRQLQTEALAGTAFIGQDHQQNQQQADWLLQDQKNQQENWLVVKGICDNLTQYYSQLEVQPVEIIPLRKVQHLRRKISAQLLPTTTDADCLQCIHPSAAVSGLPQQAALSFIKNNENFDRSWYAGTLGVMSPQQAEFCVTIRSAFVEQNKIRVFAGAGIVEDSDPLLEWQEIERKAMGLISLFNQE